MARLRDATHSGELESVRASGEPVIADFFTQSCVLCRRLEPMVAAVERDYAGKLRAFKIDAEENAELAQRYEIRGVPTLLLFNRGELVDRRVGFQTAGALREWIRAHVS